MIFNTLIKNFLPLLNVRMNRMICLRTLEEATHLSGYFLLYFQENDQFLMIASTITCFAQEQDGLPFPLFSAWFVCCIAWISLKTSIYLISSFIQLYYSFLQKRILLHQCHSFPLSFPFPFLFHSHFSGQASYQIFFLNFYTVNRLLFLKHSSVIYEMWVF